MLFSTGLRHNQNFNALLEGAASGLPGMEHYRTLLGCSPSSHLVDCEDCVSSRRATRDKLLDGELAVQPGTNSWTHGIGVLVRTSVCVAGLCACCAHVHALHCPLYRYTYCAVPPFSNTFLPVHSFVKLYHRLSERGFGVMEYRSAVARSVQSLDTESQQSLNLENRQRMEYQRQLSQAIKAGRVVYLSLPPSTVLSVTVHKTCPHGSWALAFVHFLSTPTHPPQVPMFPPLRLEPWWLSGLKFNAKKQ
jgi:hypothetical protein